MIILDTHIWVWCVLGGKPLTKRLLDFVTAHEATGLGLSVISCWEVSKLVENGKLVLSQPLQEWMKHALNYPGLKLLDLTPEICMESTLLPQPFHRDPADQIIVATSRVYDCLLVTEDAKILNYPQVKLATY